MPQLLLQVGVKREEALNILASEGMLLVLCSLIDNMPYVVAEAAVRPSLQRPAGFAAFMHSRKICSACVEGYTAICLMSSTVCVSISLGGRS